MRLNTLDKWFLWISVAGGVGWGSDLLNINLLDTIEANIPVLATLIKLSTGVAAFYIGYRLINKFK